jgi:sialic acid synthase
VPRELTIAGVRIADDAPCYLIAEIGNNHGGSVGEALELIEICAKAGASAVKFQRRTNAAIYTRALLDQPYEHRHSFGATYGAHRAALELPLAAYPRLREIADLCGITAFATAFDEQAADELVAAGLPALKIASGDLTNTPLLRHVAQLGVPLVISTGGGTLEDTDRAVETVSPHTSDFALLHCTAAYPVLDFTELNLQVIPVLRARYPDTVIGWSGHDSGIAMSVIAYTLGARIIEKHVTRNRALKGTDHAFSLEPAGLRKLVRDLARARAALGTGEKVRYASEAPPLRKMAKSLVAARPLPAGHVLRREDLARKSPADGLPPYWLEQVIGFPLATPLAEDECLTLDHLKSEARA